MQKPTISDVAKKAGVSRATVSRVLNDQPGVGDDLRKQVMECIKEMKYTPNTIAKSLIKGHINIVGLVFGDVRNPFYAELAFQIQKILNQNGYMVMVFNTEYKENQEIEYIRMAMQFNFAGMILITAQNKELEGLISQMQMPVVMVNRAVENFKGDTVFMDNFQAGYLAAKHLAELGYPEIAYIAGPLASSSSKLRYEGFVQLMKNYQIPFDEEKHLFFSNLKMEDGYEVAKQYVAKFESLPSAIVISNDLTAIGFMDYCQSCGVRIPEDLSVVSYDNISFSALHSIGLTTIDQRAQEMSESAANLIMRRINDRDVPLQRVMLEPHLVVRTSTKPYQEGKKDFTHIKSK